MKIAFICGCSEPGADGVGDYTYDLADYLAQCGHHCLVIALHDKFASRHYLVPPESCPSETVQVCRLSCSDSWASRLALLSLELKRFSPDWISLQYVPYAFSQKGVPVSLLAALKAVKPLANWHVMLHELWVDPTASLKNRFFSILQKRLLARLFFTLSPSVVHTSNLFYLSCLASIDQRAKVLPLFSSIPVVPDSPVLHEPKECWSFIFFGSIHPEWLPAALLSELQVLAEASRIPRLSFVSIGSAGSHGSKLWQQQASIAPDWIEFVALGPLPAEQISRQLQGADFGITTTPSHLLGKSASVAAMLAHGLPVIVPRVENTDGPWHAAVQADHRFILLDSHFSDRFLQVANSPVRRLPEHDQLASTADQFVASLRPVL